MLSVYIISWFSIAINQHVASQFTITVYNLQFTVYNLQYSQFIDFVVKWTLLDILGRGGV